MTRAATSFNAGDILVNQFNQAGTQLSNDVTALPDGGFEVVWEDVAAGVDRVQRFDAAGHLVGIPVTISNLATFDVNAATLTNERSVYTINDFSSGNNNTDSSILLNPQPNDFNSDGASDILWQNNDGTGRNLGDERHEPDRRQACPVANPGTDLAAVRTMATSTATAIPTSSGRTTMGTPRSG